MRPFKPFFFSAVSIVFWILSFAFVTASGCNSKDLRPTPPTYKVTGLVLTADGQPAANSLIVFRPISGSVEMKATGLTSDEGLFSLSVLYADRKIEGAAEGTYEAYLLKPLQRQGEGGEKVPLKGDFIVKREDNHFEITLPPGTW